MTRFPSSTVQQAPQSSQYNTYPVLAYAQPVADVENARPAQQPVNLVVTRQTALIYVRDRPVIRPSVTVVQAPRAAPPLQRLESPTEDMCSPQTKIMAAALGVFLVVGAGAASYYKSQNP